MRRTAGGIAGPLPLAPFGINERLVRTSVSARARG
jgi:hypothetical protein